MTVSYNEQNAKTTKLDPLEHCPGELVVLATSAVAAILLSLQSSFYLTDSTSFSLVSYHYVRWYYTRFDCRHPYQHYGYC